MFSSGNKYPYLIINIVQLGEHPGDKVVGPSVFMLSYVLCLMSWDQIQVDLDNLKHNWHTKFETSLLSVTLGEIKDDE